MSAACANDQSQRTYSLCWLCWLWGADIHAQGGCDRLARSAFPPQKPG